MMRRVLFWVIGAFAVVFVLLLLTLGVTLHIANTPSGRTWIERTVNTLGAGKFSLSGLAGHFPDDLHIAHIAVRDSSGTWLSIDNLSLDWTPSRLLIGVADIDRLAADKIVLARLPKATQGKAGGGMKLPVRINIHKLNVEQVNIAQAVAGTAASLRLDGAVRFDTLEQAEAKLSLTRRDKAGSYTLKGHSDRDNVQLNLAAQEPAQGLLVSLAKLPEQGPLSLQANLAGPRDAVDTVVRLQAGLLQAHIKGKLNLEERRVDLAVYAHAPALQLTSQLAWETVRLDAQVQGPFAKPGVNGTLVIKSLSVAGASVRRIVVTSQASMAEMRLNAKVVGLTVPGLPPEATQTVPLTLQAKARLDTPGVPVDFHLRHPLLATDGKAVLTDRRQADIKLVLPDLKTLAAAAGQVVQGRASLDLKLHQENRTWRVDADGKLALSPGAGPVALLGESAQLGASAVFKNQDVSISRLRLDGKNLRFSATGGYVANRADLNWELALANVNALKPELVGQLKAQGNVSGPRNQLDIAANLQGDLSVRNQPREPISAALQLHHMPQAPTGQLTAQGRLAGAPLELNLSGHTLAETGLAVTIDRATWKSARATGSLVLAKQAAPFTGKIELSMTRLADLQALLGQPLAGAVNATLETVPQANRPALQARLTGRDISVGGKSVAETNLSATITDPWQQPIINGRVTLAGIAASTLKDGTARLEIAGPINALGLNIAATLPQLNGADARLNGAARLDARDKTLALNDLRLRWRDENLSLLSPAQIAFNQGLSVDRLRLGLREGRGEIAGSVSPTLDLRVAVENAPAALADLVAPKLDAAGVLQGNATLTGTLSRPTGVITVAARKLRIQSESSRALPPADLTARAVLNGDSAMLDSRLQAGTNYLTASGPVPLATSGPLDLRVAGAVNLQVLDPLLTASGRRGRGQATLAANVNGTLAEPRLTGVLQLAQGEYLDYTNGTRLTDITAVLRADGEAIRIVSFEGRAEPGTIAASGTVNLVAGWPVDVTVTARNARLLASERLTVEVNADLSLRGQAKERLLAAGTVRINRAEINIPERLPTSIAVLDMCKPPVPKSSSVPASAPAPATTMQIWLDLTLDAPNQIFLRGRGVDAELGGEVRLRGPYNEPRPSGNFDMRRGQISLAGQTLIFNKGQVGFTGGGLTNPSLNFVTSKTQEGITASLTIGGTVRTPKITLTSEPEMPADEVLAYVLFGRSAVRLSALEAAQIAAALASLTGIGGGSDPLAIARKTFGLDRLTVGSGSSGSPTLEAGRYVSPGVYLGVKQGFSSSQTQAAVQIDISKRLKLEGTVGNSASTNPSTNTGGSSLGIIYQFEY